MGAKPDAIKIMAGAEKKRQSRIGNDADNKDRYGYFDRTTNRYKVGSKLPRGFDSRAFYLVRKTADGFKIVKFRYVD